MKYQMLAMALLTCFVVHAQQNMDTVTIRPVKVKDNLYMLKGNGGNIGLLTGTDGAFMVDDQYAPLSEKITTAVSKLTPHQVKYMVNTHVHGDHSGGNENFRKQGVTIMAQENVRVRMKQGYTNPMNNQTTPPRDQAAWPLVTFDETIRLHLNGEDIEVTHFKVGAHTDGDAVVRFVQANVLHTGDLFVRYGYPYIDASRGGSYKGFIQSLDKIIAMANDQTVIMPGHGELATKNDVKILRDKLVDIGDKVAAAVKKGKKLEDIPALGITDPYDAELGKGFQKGKDFVMMIGRELGAK